MFVTRNGSEFRLGLRPYKFFGGNNYGLIGSSMAQADVAALFAAAKADGITAFRTWALDPFCGFRQLLYSLGTNLITNPSFESGTTNWSVDASWSRVNTDAEDGSYSMKMVAASGYDGLMYTLTVAQNTNYVVDFWYKTTVNSGFPPVVFVGT